MGLISVMIIITVLLFGLTVALPSVLQEGQREREEEVIFRGTQYARAVALFHRQFFRYPMNVKELVQTNGMRFLRQEYTDPLDPEGKWRFIHANAMGVLIDSKNPSLGPNMLGPGGSPGGGMGQGLASTSVSFGVNPSSGSGDGTGTPDTSSQESSPSTNAMGQTGSEDSSASSPSDSPVQTGFIMGVAPTSNAKSIRVWNKHDHYDHWEFLGIDRGLFGVQVGLPGLQMPGIGGQAPTPIQVGSPGVPLPPTPPANPQPPAD